MLGMKSRICVVVLSFLLVDALGSLRSLHAGLDQERKEITDVQILETPDTVFVFVQVDNVVEYNDLFSALASRHPTRQIASQSLITIDGNGNRTETPIVFSEDEAGPSLHTNFDRVFAFKGSVFLMQVYTPSGRPILHKWQKDRFIRVPDEDAGDLEKIISAIQKIKSLVNPNVILDELTKDSGWRFIESSDFLNYICNKHDLIIKLKPDDRRFSIPFIKSVVAESLSTTKPWTKTLIEIDVRKKKVVQKMAEKECL
jgi:hypothetical protein